MKVAILHEMLVKLGWAEKVVETFLEIFPDADLFTLIYDEKKVWKVFKKEKIHSQVFKLKSQKKYNLFKNQRFCLPVMAESIEALDFSKYDLVLCSSSWFAHGAITKPETKFVVYYHSPSRYIWDYTFEYQKSLKLNKFLKYFLQKLLSKIRIWDFIASRRVDIPIMASENVAKRLKKYYKRNDYKILYPSVEIKKFVNSKDYEKKDYYITIAALTEWKRLDILIKAFNKMPEKKLKIIWVWNYENEYKKLVKSKNIEFLWYKSWKELTKLLKQAKGFLFVSNDDFWIAPVEAMACATPVFWLAKWWLLETNKAWITWDFFMDENWSDFIENFKKFEKNINSWVYQKKNLISQAQKFSKENFKKELRKILTP